MSPSNSPLFYRQIHGSITICPFPQLLQLHFIYGTTRATTTGSGTNVKIVPLLVPLRDLNCLLKDQLVMNEKLISR